MRRFAALADLIHGENEMAVGWNSVREFTRSVEPSLLAVAQEARRLILTEEMRLGLGAGTEPFRVDLGLHRWLHDESEPAYSDWLQWIAQALENKEWILRLLGVPNGSSIIDAATPKATAVRREVPVWERKGGGLIGFLDLDIWFRPEARVVVEVKTFDDSFEKQIRYKQALDVDEVETDFILLTKDHAELEEVYGFRTRNWESFCVEGRKLIPEVARGKGLVVAALILAFIGAVEQNILGLTGFGLRSLFSDGRDRSIGPVDLKTMRYLQKIVQEGETYADWDIR